MSLVTREGKKKKTGPEPFILEYLTLKYNTMTKDSEGQSVSLSPQPARRTQI